MNYSNSVQILRQLAKEIRLGSSSSKIYDSPAMQWILSQYRYYRVTDQQLCKAQEEMIHLACTYQCYLKSVRSADEITVMFKGKGERSVQETANMVGFKLPHDPK